MPARKSRYRWSPQRRHPSQMRRNQQSAGTGAARVPSKSPRTYTPWTCATDVAQLRRAGPRLLAIYHRQRLERALSERVMVAVSRANACGACTRVGERGRYARAYQPTRAGSARHGGSIGRVPSDHRRSGDRLQASPSISPSLRQLTRFPALLRYVLAKPIAPPNASLHARCYTVSSRRAWREIDPVDWSIEQKDSAEACATSFGVGSPPPTRCSR
jgi:hypothetical protein